MGKETAVKQKPVCDDKDCKECTKRRNLVDETNAGRIVSYYSEGWRAGTLEAVRMYGAFQRDDEGHIISTGICTIRPLSSKYAKGIKDPVKIAIEDVRLEAAVIVPLGSSRVAEAVAATFAEPLVVMPAAEPELPPAPPTAAELGKEYITDMVATLKANATTPAPAATGRSSIVMDLDKAKAMQAAGASWTDIAVAMGYPRGKGQNRCKRAVEAGGQ